MLLELLLLATAWYNAVGSLFCPVPASTRLSTQWLHLIQYRASQLCLSFTFLLVPIFSLPHTLLLALPESLTLDVCSRSVLVPSLSAPMPDCYSSTIPFRVRLHGTCCPGCSCHSPAYHWLLYLFITLLGQRALPALPSLPSASECFPLQSNCILFRTFYVTLPLPQVYS